MDKKNTMLLTVIAVATLLVAVVGATFAYFSVTQASDTATTNITATTKSIPTFYLKGENPTISMTLTAADMAKGAADKSYFANTDGTHEDAAQQLPIAKIGATGGEATDNYTCTLTVKGTITDASNAIDALGEENVKLHLYGIITKNINLTTGASINETQEVTLAGNAGQESQTLQADLEVVNSLEDDQSTAAGKEFSIKLDTTLTGCKLVTD